MRLTSTALCLTLVFVTTAGAQVQGRTDTRSVTCAALKGIVDRAGHIVLATSATAYEAVHRDGGACQQDTTSAPAFEPTADEPACFAGWRCKPRNSDAGQSP